jgi:glycosyltransferase involved in cell wall biosynthesis
MRIAIYADRLESGGGLETHVITQINELLRRGHIIFLTANAIAADFLKMVRGDESNFHFQLFSQDPMEDLAGFRPDLIHAHPFTAIFRANKVACAINVPLFITIHGLYIFGVDRSPNGYPVAKKASKIIAVDEVVENLLRQSVAFPEKISTIYNGINRDQFYPDTADPELIKELEMDSTWKTIVVVSRLEDNKEKAVFQLMDCAPLLAERLSGLNLIIVGDGAYRDMVWLRNRAAIEKCQTLRVFRMGRRTDVSRFLQLADLVLACSRAAIEAMACQRPVYAMSDQGFAGIINYNNREVIAGRVGYHYCNDQELLDGLFKALIDQKQREKAIHDGYEMIMECYDIQKLTDMLERLYIEVLQGNDF